ncbi:Auxin-induced protein 5NG4 [Hordeum vulgare]|nr:Auxin-induced protein 5NG4 [Hordeum vulgare]
MWFFLRSCFRHLPEGTSAMFYIEEVCMGGSSLKVTCTNSYDAYHLLGQAFWCSDEFICFTVCNIYTDWDCIFSTSNKIYCLPYVFPDED